jgi:anti-sigma regulatory factor (Ser/Thr protein kinase)
MIDKSIHIKNKLEQLSLVNEFIDKSIYDNCIDYAVGTHLKLAVEEIVVNIILYAYNGEKDKDIFIKINCDHEKFTIVITDYGVAFNPVEGREPDINLPLEQRQIGGLGIFLAKKLMTHLSYLRDYDKNILILEKKLN